jgi:uncharacterized protein (DUF885 family)
MNLSTDSATPRRSRLRKWFKAVAVVGGVAILLLGALAVNVLWFKPVSFRLFCERIFLRFAVESPELMTRLGLADALGIEYFNARLDDRSEAHLRKLIEFSRSELATLRRYNRARLDESARRSADILDWFLEAAVQGGDRFFHHPYVIDQMEGIQVSLPNFMGNLHPLRTRRNAVDYVRRLERFGVAFDQSLARSRAQTERGIVPPRFVLAAILEQARSFTAPVPSENVLYTTLAGKLSAMPGLTEADRTALLARAAGAVEQVVYPAFQRLAGHVESLLPSATDEAGVWKLPDGAAYYAHCLRQHTTTTLTAEEIHQTGGAEVARITAEMRRILDAAGLRGKTVAEHMQDLARDPRFLFANDAAGRRQAIEHLQRILDEAGARMSNWFGALPKAGMVVKRVEPFREKAAAMGQYQQSSLDGSRPGIFYANLRDMNEFPRFSMRTLAYHEGIPGHHFQIALAQELRGVPTFRRVIPFSAYEEGWALYAERLMWELGFHTDSFDDLGRLQDELFRAARLVVDTGLHHKRWSRQQANDYLLQTTGMSAVDVTNEIDRYIVWPGQACAYKIGMLKILELRERTQAARGAGFSLKDFHDAVLLSGAMPLGVLERRLEQHIARSAKRSAAR